MTDIVRDRGLVVMTYARSGGTWLAQLLGSTGMLGRPEDWFNGRGYRDRGVADYPLDRAGQRAMMLERGRTPNGVFGVKLSPLRFDELAGHPCVAELRDAAFIHLVRRDRLARALSDVKAQQTRQYRASTAAQGQPRYDPAMIRRALTSQAVDEGRVQQFFAWSGIEPLEIAYEDVLGDPQAAVDRVATFLKIGERAVVDPSRVDLTVQRDLTNDDWRRRFVAEHRPSSSMPPLAIGRAGRLMQRLMRYHGRTG